MDKWSNTEQVNSPATEPGNKIGGWLYLVAIGITLAPIANFIHFKTLVETFKTADWDYVWQQGPTTVLFIFVEFGIQGYMLIFSIMLAVLFYNKKNSFPKMFIIYIISIFILGIISALIATTVPTVTPEQLAQSVAFAIYGFIFGVIWIPYFIKSKRVKETFISQ